MITATVVATGLACICAFFCVNRKPLTCVLQNTAECSTLKIYHRVGFIRASAYLILTSRQPRTVQDRVLKFKTVGLLWPGVYSGTCLAGNCNFILSFHILKRVMSPSLGYWISSKRRKCCLHDCYSTDNEGYIWAHTVAAPVSYWRSAATVTGAPPLQQ